MCVAYFSRIYFSRYFYSTFKSRLKGRIKISDKHPNSYLYSDAYYSRFVRSNNFFLEKSVSNVQVSTNVARSFFFTFDFFYKGHNYDFSWFIFKEKEDFFKKLFILFIKFRFNSFFLIAIVKLYKNLYFYKKHF